MSFKVCAFSFIYGTILYNILFIWGVLVIVKSVGSLIYNDIVTS